MSKKASIIAMAGGLTMAAILLTLIVFPGLMHKHDSRNQLPFYEISTMIDVADSVRNSIPDSAMANYSRIIDELQKRKNEVNIRSLLARSYLGLATIFYDKGYYNLSGKNDSLAMAFAIGGDDKKLLAQILVLRGLSRFKQADHQGAMVCYDQAEKLAIGIQDPEIKGKIYANRALIYSLQGENQKAIDGFNAALSIGKQLNRQSLVASSYLNLAIFLSNQSQNDSVLSYYSQALTLYQKLNDKIGASRCYMNLGNVYYGFSDFGKAIEFYQLAIKQALVLDDQALLSKGYNNLGDVYLHLGDSETAADLLFKSIKIKEQLNDKTSLARGYFGLGKIYFHRRDFPKSRLYFTKSLKINQEIKNVVLIGSCLNSIGSIYSSENKSDSAIACYNKVMEFYQEIGYLYGISNLCINLGDEYRLRKEFAKSEKLLSQALILKTEMDEEEGIAIVNNHLANLYLTQSEGLAENQKFNLLKKAEEAGLKSFITATHIGALPVRRDASKGLKKIFQMQGRQPGSLGVLRDIQRLIR
jgi:tetratricopeptide (TPR) repeat protein